MAPAVAGHTLAAMVTDFVSHHLTLMYELAELFVVFGRFVAIASEALNRSISAP